MENTHPQHGQPQRRIMMAQMRRDWRENHRNHSNRTQSPCKTEDADNTEFFGKYFSKRQEKKRHVQEGAESSNVGGRRPQPYRKQGDNAPHQQIP